MQSLFSPDSKIMQALTGLADLMILNILFVVTCIPIFTIGAASSALYTVVFRMQRQEEGGIFRTYFRSFRENFRQGTAIWLILLPLFAVGCINLIWCSAQEGTLSFILLLMTILVLAVLVLIFSYVFPLQSQFRNPVKLTLSNAFLLSIAHLPRSLVIAVVNLLPLGMAYVNLYAFMQTSLLWLFMYFAGSAFLNALLLRKVFQPYMPAPAAEEL